MKKQDIAAAIRAAAAAVMAGDAPDIAADHCGLAPSAEAHAECMAMVRSGAVPPAALDLLEILRPRQVGLAMSAVEFMAAAKPITVSIGGESVTLTPREFSSGSFGWGAYGKLPAPIAGGKVKCQMSLSLIVAGSRPATT